MTIQELIDKRVKAWQAAKDFLDSHLTEKGTLSAEDSQTYDKMEKDITDLGKEIDRMRKLADFENEMRKPTSDPILGNPGAGNPGSEKSGRASAEYKEAMMSALRSNFRNVSNVLQEGVDADGGYLVPEEMDNRIIEGLEEENFMRPLATIITTVGERKINIAASMPAAAWIDEGEALSFGEGKFKQMILDAHKLYVAIKVTEELLYDSGFDLNGYITRKFTSAIANAEEEAFLTGDGNGKPAGIFDPTAGGEITEELTAAIKSDNVIDLVYSLKRAYRKNAVFILNDKTVATLRKLKDNNGAYIWQPSYKEDEPDKLLGYRLYTSSYAPEGSIAFGDMSYYNIGDRGTRSLAELKELFAGNGMVGYIAKERVDGKLVLPEAVKIIKTKSE
ncbi:MAG: phage major capsid protein [Ruminococcus sp.]|nr:phage major capsid protein [Ruminococcus sp.]